MFISLVPSHLFPERSSARQLSRPQILSMVLGDDLHTAGLLTDGGGFAMTSRNRASGAFADIAREAP
ncbi:hypothetical protein C3941_18805 [Kaistia algarum]|nr:hypothetical protein C3941_18805 [Kaistia algarum]